MITYPTDPARLDYVSDPWTDEDSGTQWLYQPAANRWVPYVVSGGGASRFEDLTDKATADLPAINTLLSSALGGKQATLSNYSTISGLTDYPPTFPPTLITHTAAVFVATVGDDNNDGLSPERPKATIGAAIDAAELLIDPGGATGVRVHVMDGATYTENIEVPDKVAIDAKGATLVGTASITGGSELWLDRHFAASTDQRMLTLEGAGNGPAIYNANISDGRGQGGALTGVSNVRNVGGGGRNLFAHVGILYVSTGGTGIGDVSIGNAGHIHIEIPDLYLTGTNAVGILGSAQGIGASNIVGWIDHIINLTGASSSTGILMAAAGATVKLTCSEIIANTAYNIGEGDLYLSCPRIEGTRTGTPKQLMLGTEDASATISAGKTILWGESPDATLQNLGGGTAGRAVFGASAHTGAGSTRKLMGLDVSDNVTFTNLTASGTLSVTGASTLAAYSETVVALGTVAEDAALAITAGTVITATLTSSTECTFTMPTAAAGKSFLLHLKQASTPTTAIFTGVIWSGGAAYAATQTAGRVDIISFATTPNAAGDGWLWVGSVLPNHTLPT